MRKLQKNEICQQSSENKSAKESKKLQMEFERKQREHKEHMRQDEEKPQLRLMEAELDSCSGERSDKSKQLSETESDDEQPLKESTNHHEDYVEYVENLNVHLTEVAHPSIHFWRFRVF